MANIIPMFDGNKKLLDQATIQQLIKQTQAGCTISKEKVIEANLKLVLNVVHRFRGNEAMYEELFQVGCIGLMKSVEKFDLSRNVHFSTYAIPMIIGEIRRYLRDNQTMRVSRSIRENAKKIGQFKEAFLRKHERDPRISEVVAGTGIEEEDVVLAIGSINYLIPFDQSTNKENDDGEMKIEHLIADKKNNIESWVTQHQLKESFQHLNDRERMVVKLRYYDDLTQMEIGDELGVSQAHISRIERNALKKLRGVM